jgi:hypothetical protein
MKQTVQRILIGYSTVLSTIIMVLVLTGATSQRNESFNTIKVHRIDVVETDGTLRMVIANHERLPGVIVKGKEFPKVDRPEAGLLFYNDEGTENGGLIFGGHRNGNGEVVNSGVSLSFDKYGQARQIVQLAGVDDRENKFAGLAVNDQNRRIWVGRKEDGASVVSLMDGNGRKRIVMQVTADGAASLDFLDAEGHVARHLVPSN